MNNSLERLVRWVGILFWLPYFLSILYPESWWSFHFISFLPDVFKYGILGISLVLIVFTRQVVTIIKLDKIHVFSATNKSSWTMVIVVSVLMGLCYYNFPMHKSFYGDAEVFKENMGEATHNLDDKYIDNLLTLDIFSPKSGNRTVLSAVRILSYHFETSHRTIYQILGAAFGAIYIFIWLAFVIHFIQQIELKVFFAISGILAPFTQFFFGYEEIYAPAIPAIFGYFMTVVLYLRSNEKKYLFWMGIMLFLSLKLHSSSFILIPSFLLSLLLNYRHRLIWINKLFTWKAIGGFVLLPIIMGGAFVYFFVLEDYKDLRFVNENVDIYTRMFLPILSPPEPLDRYTLLSFNHFFDYLNLIFLWSGSIAFLIIIVVVNYRTEINWSRPEVLIIGATTALYMLLFFMINPLMSMPIDCDYFSLPAASLFFLGIVISSQVKSGDLRLLIAPGLALSLLCIPIFITNHKKEYLSDRMEHVGIYVFKTYWIRSAGDITAGLELEDKNSLEYEERYLRVLNSLKPHANEAGDQEYANLLWRLGKYYRTQQKDYKKALTYHLEAQSFDPDLVANYIGLTESSYFLEKYEDAYRYSLVLIKNQYPNEKQAMRIAIECSMLAGMYERTVDHCNAYLEKWRDEDIMSIRSDLLAQMNNQR